MPDHAADDPARAVCSKRVFLLGPSHHVYLENCALSQCDEWQTPFGNLTIDKETTNKLYSEGNFGLMTRSVDENEHSMEMHAPYIYKIFEKKIDQVKLVPILVGNLSYESEQAFGKLLAPYLQDPESIFIISSDFCHWGSRFRYIVYSDAEPPSQGIHRLDYKTYNPASLKVPIWKSIEKLDKEGMDIIETMSHGDFEKYLRKTRNTICGRHPIGVLLAAINEIAPAIQEKRDKIQLKFV
ncbi:hypothetical protein EV182_002302, partial [Spiromyces aspiralis]